MARFLNEAPLTTCQLELVEEALISTYFLVLSWKWKTLSIWDVNCCSHLPTLSRLTQFFTPRHLLYQFCELDIMVIVSLHLYCHPREQRSCFVLQYHFSASVNPFARAQTATLCSFNLGYRCQDNDWQDGHQNERGLHHVGKRLGFSSCGVWN